MAYIESPNKFILKLHPSDFIKNPYQKINSVQKLNFEFHHLQEESILSYLSFCTPKQTSYQIYNLKTRSILSEKEKLDWLYQGLQSVLPKIDFASNNSLEFITPVINNLCFYNSLEFIQDFEDYLQVFLKPEFSYQFLDITKFNVMKSALEGEKYEIVNWLVSKYKFSFFKNCYPYNLQVVFPEKVSALYKICEIDKITEHLKYDSEEVKTYFGVVKSNNLVKLWISQILESIQNNPEDSNQKLKQNKFVNKIVNHYLKNENLTMIKYFFSHTYFHINYFSSFTVDNWIKYLAEVVYERYGDYQENSKKTKLLKLVCDYIQNYTLIWDEFVSSIKLKNSYLFDNSNSLLCILVKLPKIIPMLKRIKGSDTFLNQNIESSTDIYNNLIRYGTFETYQYLEPEIICSLQYIILDDILDDFDHMVTLALCNKDIRILHHFYEIYESKRKNMPDIPYFTLMFLKLPKLKDEQKIKRLKFLSSKISPLQIRQLILDSAIIPYISDSLLTWILAKFYHNSFSAESTKAAEMIKLFNYILITEKIKNIKFVLERMSNYNNYRFILVLLKHGYFWTDDLVQYLLSSSTPLKEQSDGIKKNILYELSSSSFHNVKFEEWIKLIKYFKKNGFRFEPENYIFCRYTDPYIVRVAKSCNHSFLKALIIEGVSVKPLFDNYKFQTHSYWIYTHINAWAKIYILIKRLEFKRNFRKKKEHRTNFLSTIIDLKARPPSLQKEKPVLQKGGKLYYRDLDELDAFMGSSSVEFVNAQHIEPFPLLQWLRKKHSILSQKADGTHITFTEQKDNLYPVLPDIYQNTELEAEFVPGLNLNFIFQIRSNFHLQTNFIEDYLDLKNEHPQAKYIGWENYVFTESDTFNSIKQKLDTEWSAIQIFRNENINKAQDIWWPKPVYSFSFNNPQKKLEILKHIQEIHRRKYILYGSEKIKNDVDLYFPTDGLILMENLNRKEMWKLKPVFHMTADLLHEGQIKRCQWNSSDAKWDLENAEVRHDKKHPNPRDLVRKLELYHRNPWQLDDLQIFLKPDFYYSENNKKDRYSSEFIQGCQELTRNFMENQILNKLDTGRDKILDLGCGFGEKSIWKKDNLQIEGMDIEPKIWLQSKNRKRNIYYQDISQPWSCNQNHNRVLEYYSSTGLIKSWNSEQKNYKLVTSFMSWHNIFQNEKGLENITNELEKVTQKGSRLVISFLDKNILFSEKTELEIRSQSFMKLVTSNKMQYQYSWRHTEPQTETIQSQFQIEDSLKSNGWLLESQSEASNIDCETDNPWFQVLQSYKVLCFIKK